MVVAVNGVLVTAAWLWLPLPLQDLVFTLHGALAFPVVLATWMLADVPATNVLGSDADRVLATLDDPAGLAAREPRCNRPAEVGAAPRFGIAGELYSQRFYDQLAKVLRRRGKLFHYVGTPNKLSRGRDLQREVSRRLQRAGFDTEYSGDGILACRGPGSPSR